MADLRETLLSLSFADGLNTDRVLRDCLLALEERITRLEQNNAKREDDPETVPRGKYRGRARSWVVQHDPHHVVWLFENKHSSSMGYNANHLQEAQKAIAGGAEDSGRAVVSDSIASRGEQPPWD